MQEADDRNAVFRDPIIYDIPSYAIAAIASADVIAGGAELRRFGKLFESRSQVVDIVMCLFDSPFTKRIEPNRLEIADRRRC